MGVEGLLLVWCGDVDDVVLTRCCMAMKRYAMAFPYSLHVFFHGPANPQKVLGAYVPFTYVPYEAEACCMSEE